MNTIILIKSLIWFCEYMTTDLVQSIQSSLALKLFMTNQDHGHDRTRDVNLVVIHIFTLHLWNLTHHSLLFTNSRAVIRQVFELKIFYRYSLFKIIRYQISLRARGAHFEPINFHDWMKITSGTNERPSLSIRYVTD